MPYNQGMTRAQGDPGFFGTLGSILGGVSRLVPGPIGSIGTAIFGGRAPKAPTIQSFVQQQPTVFRPTPGVAGMIQRAVPGGATGFEGCPPRKKRRRINPNNVKALRRANARQKAYLRQVDRTLATMPTRGQVQKRRAKIRGV